MATLVKNPDTKFSTPVYAVASYGTSPEADSYKIDGLHVRNIYVNHKDAEVALSELNLQSLGDYSFERHHYPVEQCQRWIRHGLLRRDRVSAESL